MRGRKHVDLPQIEYPVAARQEDLDVACAADAREHEGARGESNGARTSTPHARRTLQPKLEKAKAVSATVSAIVDLDPRDVVGGAKVDAKVRVCFGVGVAYSSRSYTAINASRGRHVPAS